MGGISSYTDDMLCDPIYPVEWYFSREPQRAINLVRADYCKTVPVSGRTGRSPILTWRLKPWIVGPSIGVAIFYGANDIQTQFEMRGKRHSEKQSLISSISISELPDTPAEIGTRIAGVLRFFQMPGQNDNFHVRGDHG
jgi:hypothetical protein